jgi:CheY-like chemotaxis protein
VVFSVADTGSGIPEDKRQTIFERFQRSTDPAINNNGLGLGLSICRGIVKLLGGSIWVESEIDKGSVFSFNVPVKFNEEFEIKEEVATLWNHLSPPLVKGPILIVDDDDINGEILKNVLREFQLILAKDGKSALEEFKRSPEIKLILLDIGLPDMDGKEVLRRFRQMNPEVPIFILTAYASEKEKNSSELAGCNEFMTKPVNFQLLLKKVTDYLSKYN